MRSKKPFRSASEFFTPVKNQPTRTWSSFAPALKNPFRILRTVFASERKQRSGFKGLSPCEMYFWVVQPPKSTIEYSTYEQHIEIGTAKTTRKYTATQKRLRHNKGGFSMSEKNSKQLSISFRVDAGVIEHNNRDFIARNVDGERIGDNIAYKQEDLREFYQKLFGQALADYNASKKRPYQRIPDYYEHIKNGKQEKLFEEIVVQFGDMETCGLKSGKWEEAKLMLDDYMKSFEQRNPNLKVFNAVMHLDEATPHLHIDFVPITHIGSRGLSTRVSMSGALREQGFTSANKMQNEWAAWEERERGIMTDILRAHDLSRDVKNDTHAHLTVDEYKQQEMKKAEIRKLNAHINELKKKNPTELTEEEITLIKNQNDYMRSEILNYRDKVAALSRKVGAKFVPFEIFSEEKLQYVAAELEKSGIPFVEENSALHIPDYAQKTAAAIAVTFRPNKVEGVREKIKLEIDRLIYSSANLDDLLNKLKMHGYEIKHGKHLAVKPTFAERFVRLKTLGDAYLPKNLEQRISERDKFTDAVREKFKSANTIEKKFHVTVMDIVIEIKQFRLMPKKLDERKIYAFKNDANIDYLSRQLMTLGEFGLSSREQIYEKADELKRGIDEKNEKIRFLSEEIPTLKSDISQLRFLFAPRSSKPDAMTQTKIAAAREIAEKHNVKTEADIENLEKRLKALPDLITSAKNEVANEQLKLKRISDLITAYEKIVEGNYIDNLIKAYKEQEQKRAAEKRS